MKLSPLAQFDVVCIIPIWFGKYDISLTNLSVTVFFVIFLGIIIFYYFYMNHLIPRTWQIFLENIFLFVYSIIFQQMGKNGLMYFPFIFTLFSFMLMLNLFSMLPYGFAPTSHFFWTLYFSLSMCLGIFMVGMMKHKLHFFKLFVPEVPLMLYPMMISIEILSYIISSFSLAISLSANLIAGHTLVHMLADFVSVMCNLKFLIVFLPFMLLLTVLILEFGVACLQAYMFIMLICMYLNDSIHLLEH